MAYKLTVQRRENRPRSVLTRIRREGRVPGIMYGKDLDNLPVQLEMGELIRLLQRQGTTSLIDLEVDGKTHHVMISELQRDRVKDSILHVDFKVVNMKELIDTEVAVTLEGEAQGVKEGGILQQQTRTVQIRCLPDDIPDHVSLDISALAIGDSVSVRDVKLPAKVELMSDPEEMIASVLPPQMEQEKEAEERDEAAAGADQEEQEREPAEDGESGDKKSEE